MSLHIDEERDDLTQQKVEDLTNVLREQCASPGLVVVDLGSFRVRVEVLNRSLIVSLSNDESVGFWARQIFKLLYAS